MIANMMEQIDNFGASEAYRAATWEGKQEFIKAVYAMEVVIEQVTDKYRNKKTPKGEFVACCLLDYFYDVSPLEGNLQEQMESIFGDEPVLAQYTEFLSGIASNIHQIVREIKKVYKNNKAEILDLITNADGSVDLEEINDCSREYLQPWY
ncbi:hypothetical protein FOD75_11385 (plasmid) [Limosilactobacillus reuteri]|uniref:Uncharacterized protein n=1 Tax=Limosilactobacillus reuteri TaxID=1598 RepID=A0A517D8M3_LIMRT|nr:hypothetical protein [Limosilactobacillus reuteri]QDR73686.1 hypothetical protein FOD75_11385 [Limosilactobacillus reuteri]